MVGGRRRGSSKAWLCVVQILLCCVPSKHCVSPNGRDAVLPSRDLERCIRRTHRQMRSRGVDLRVLRGGCSSGEERSSTNVRVPSERFPTLQDGLDATCANDTCIVSGGCYSFGQKGPYPMERRVLHLQGKENTWIMGRWFSEKSTCNVTRVNLYADETQIEEEDEVMGGRTVVMVESSWYFLESAIQCVDGIALAVIERSTTDLNSCVVGGSGGADERLARIGIAVGDDCKATISKSTITWCKQFGFTVSDNALLQVARSSIIDNQIGVSIDGDCKISCELTAFTNRASSLKIQDRFRYMARVSAKKCRFDDNVWFGGLMPVREPDDPPDILGTDEFSDLNCLENCQAREYLDEGIGTMSPLGAASDDSIS